MKTLIHVLILISFFLSATIGPAPVFSANAFFLPAPGIMLHLSPKFNPPILKGIKVFPNNPFQFEFILDKGDSFGNRMSSPNVSVGDLQKEQLNSEASKLIKYFLASLSVPEQDLWVNLSPYEKNRIIPQSFGLTEMGRNLLAEDYLLKQITASLIYPEDTIGKKFWKRVYEESARRFGTTNISVNTFNKVWIVPETAVIYENAKASTAYVVESKLKVMLEQDYLSLSKHDSIKGNLDILSKTKDLNKINSIRDSLAMPQNDMSLLGSQVLREIVIPELTREVNENKSFAQLRQVYNSLILATWYKKKIKDSILEKIYADKNLSKGTDPKQGSNIDLIYQRYLKAFKKGVYNYIKEDIDPITQQEIPRKYFSGGVQLSTFAMRAVSASESKIPKFVTNAMKISTELKPAMQISGNHDRITYSQTILHLNDAKNENIFTSLNEKGIIPGGSEHALRSADMSRSNKISGALFGSSKELPDILYDNDSIIGGGRSLMGVLQETNGDDWREANKTIREERMRNGIIVLQRFPIEKIGREFEFDPYAGHNESEVWRFKPVPLTDLDVIFVPEGLAKLALKTIDPKFHSKIKIVQGHEYIRSATIGISGNYEIPDYKRAISEYIADLNARLSDTERRNGRFWLHAVRLSAPGDIKAKYHQYATQAMRTTVKDSHQILTTQLSDPEDLPPEVNALSSSIFQINRANEAMKTEIKDNSTAIPAIDIPKEDLNISKFSPIRALSYHAIWNPWENATVFKAPLTVNDHLAIGIVSAVGGNSVNVLSFLALKHLVQSSSLTETSAVMILSGVIFGITVGFPWAFAHFKEYADARLVYKNALKYVKNPKSVKADKRFLKLVTNFETDNPGWKVRWTDDPYVLALPDAKRQELIMSIGWVVYSNDRIDRRLPYLSSVPHKAKGLLGKIRQHVTGLYSVRGVLGKVNDGIKSLKKGGIDFTPAMLHVQTRQGEGEIKFHFDPAQLAQFQNAASFTPVIINIQLITNIHEFLGMI